ncbi:hemophore-related protein [Mycobacterium deserti]|uniref:Hemophore-related protein n=1 Tax=Mycobacterium deserti TaxID=2978347 RepID=A0ABT2M6U7_9MYCO|nr:hemophore-related protein [Mycobacterium deserti]MCT7657980.1 hemophore-related protein [Mycobacterium deserti]
MKLLVASALAAVPLTLGIGVASAQPAVDAIVNSTCSYPQVMAALKAQDPKMASQVSANPAMVAGLKQLVAAGPDERRRMVSQWQNVPAVQPYIGLISSVVGTCNSY